MALWHCSSIMGGATLGRKCGGCSGSLVPPAAPLFLLLLGCGPLPPCGPRAQQHCAPPLPDPLPASPASLPSSSPKVKNIDIEAMPRSEEKEMFKDYMEEFNTATLPHRWALAARVATACRRAARPGIGAASSIPRAVRRRPAAWLALAGVPRCCCQLLPCQPAGHAALYRPQEVLRP